MNSIFLVKLVVGVSATWLLGALAANEAHAQALDKVQVQLNDGDLVQRYSFTQSLSENDVSCKANYYGDGVDLTFAIRTAGNTRSVSVSLPDITPIVVPIRAPLSSFQFTFGNRSDPFYPGVTYTYSPFGNSPKSSCTFSINDYNPTHPTVPAKDYYSKMGQLRGQIRCSNLRYSYSSTRNTPVEALVDFSCPYSYY